MPFSLSLITDSWFLWAAIASLCMAIIAQFNHKRRLDPQYLNAWHSTFAAGMLLAAIPFMIWPGWEEGKGFYAIAVLNGVVLAIGMVAFFWLSLRRAGRVTSMVIPIASIAAFATWWLMVPESHPAMLQNPARVYFTVFCILGVCFAIQKVRANDSSWETFIIVLPIGMAFGVRDALTKYVISPELHIYATAMTFTLISVIVWACIAWLATIPEPPGGRKAKPFNLNLLWGSFWCGFWTVWMLLAGVIALTLSPNPAYPGIIMALTPLWLYAYNHLRGIRDDVSPIASAVIILCALGLMISTL